MITVNGEELKLPDRIMVSELLALLGYQSTRVVVEHNGQIVPKSGLSETAVTDGDILEIVCFVGGG